MSTSGLPSSTTGQPNPSRRRCQHQGNPSRPVHQAASSVNFPKPASTPRQPRVAGGVNSKPSQGGVNFRAGVNDRTARLNSRTAEPTPAMSTQGQPRPASANSKQAWPYRAGIGPKAARPAGIDSMRRTVPWPAWSSLGQSTSGRPSPSRCRPQGSPAWPTPSPSQARPTQAAGYNIRTAEPEPVSTSGQQSRGR